MPKCCVVSGCKNVGSGDKRDPSITWHRFPLNPAVKQKWLDNLNKISKNGGPWEPYKAATICSAHFKPSCFHSIKSVRQHYWLSVLLTLQ